jgi:hypothetical protein
VTFSKYLHFFSSARTSLVCLSTKRVYSHETPAAVSFLDPNTLASAPSVDTSNTVAAPASSGDGSNVVTAAEQDAQEGRSSLD